MRKTATTQIAMKLNAPTPQILAAKLNHNNLIHVRSVQDKNNYVCGIQLFQEGHEYLERIVFRMPLSCEIAVEAWYYSSKSTMLPKVSYHSGGRAGSSLCDNNIIKRLNKQFAKVCPISYFVSVMQNSLQHGIRTRISLPRKRRNEYFVTGSIFVLISFFCYLFI